MKQLSDLGAMRIGAAIQSVCANVDFDVLSLPGGSLIAVVLWLYASAAGSVRRASRFRTSRTPGHGSRCGRLARVALGLLRRWPSSITSSDRQF
jgi:hypothetical protein